MEHYVNVAPIVQYNDMSSYPMYPTPSGSEDSRSPQYTMLTNAPGTLVGSFESMHFSQTGQNPGESFLEIVEQPVDKFRFRYKSEMSGTHGSLSGVSTEKNRKPTYPTVKLHNFDKPAIVRCSLYTYSKDAPEHFRRPHPHRLVMKNDAEEKVDPHDKRVDPKIDSKVVFRSMGIIHTAKKHIQDELRIKKSKLKIEEIRQTEPHGRPLTTREEADIKRQIMDEEKSVNLNVVCLRFDAFSESANGVLTEICKPLYSNPIFNLKSAMTGDLKIVRMDHCTSPASGGKEIFLLVEKVAKKNIKVHFFELDPNDHEKISWSAEAKFHENDVHHQYAIVLKTPAYQNPTIEEATKDVFIQLFRPSDGETSEPRPFTYYPDRGTSSKRKRRYDDYTSSSSMSLSLSAEIPPVIFNMTSVDNPDMLSEELRQNALNINSEEFKNMFSEVLDVFTPQMAPMMEYYQPSVQCDAVARDTGASKQKDLNFIKKQYFQTVAYLNSGQPEVDKMVRKKFVERNDDGNNILHLCHVHHTDEYARKLRPILLQVIEKRQLWDLLNLVNGDEESIVHLAIRNGRELDQLRDIPLEHVTFDRKSALCPLHMAVEYDYGVEELCARLADKTLVDRPNAEGINALQYAVEVGKLDAARQLLAHGAKPNVQDNRTGNNILHRAILNEREDIVEFLVGATLVNKAHENYEGKDCVTLAKECLAGEKRRAILKMLHVDVDDFMLLESALVKEEDDSESESEDDSMSADAVKTEEEVVSNDGQGRIEAEGPLDMERIPLGFVHEMAQLRLDQKTICQLYEDLNFGYMLDTDAFEGRNKMEFLVHLALTNGVRVAEIRKAMHSRGLTQGVKCIDRMMKH